MKKTQILPIISVICLGVAAITGHQVSASVQDEIATIGAAVIGSAITIWGIIKDHQKGGVK
jgi:hypothetical protein